MKKKLLLMFMFLMFSVLVFSVTSVSAEEVQDSHNHPICDSRCVCGKGHTSVTWEPLTSDITNLSAGYYYVENDITYPNYTSLTITGDVYICLNGNKITQNTSNDCIMIKENGHLTICDCIGSGVISNSYSNGGSAGCVYLNGKSSMTLYGGTIKGNAFDAIYCSTTGNLNIYGGTITGHFEGIGVHKVNDIVISSGTITSSKTGGIEFEYASFRNITISGGTFEGPDFGMCFSGTYTCNGGVDISGGTFNGYGPVPNATTYALDYYGLSFTSEVDSGCNLRITGGTFKGARGGFYSLNKKMNATISGGTFYNGTREHAVHIKNGRVSINGGKIYYIDCDDGSTVSIYNGEILGVTISGGFYSSSNLYVHGGTIGRIGYNKNNWAISCVSGNPKYTIYVYVYGGTIVGTEYAIRGNSTTKMMVSGGNLTGEKKDIFLSKTSSSYYDAYLSLYGYNGKTINVTTSSSVEEGSYIAKDVSNDGLIVVDDAKNYSVYNSSNKSVQIMRKHFFGDWIDEVPASCTVNGTKGYKVCSDCGKYFDENGTVISDLIIKAGHQYGEWIGEVAATCTIDGVKAHKTCSCCGKHFDKNGTEIPDLNILAEHTFGGWTDEVAPTRTSDGVKGHKNCQVCEKHFDIHGEQIDNIVIKAYISLLNKVEIYEELSAEIGVNNILQSLSFATDKDASALYCFIKYPDTLSLKSVTSKDFAYVGLEDEYTEDGFKTAIILAQYSETELMPKNEILTPFELTFDVSKSATPGIVQIEATEDSCLIGNETYFFEERIPGTLEILPKLAESLEVSGADVISSETTYTAIVNPDYTTDKSVEWSVDNEGVATISENGVVTPVTSGTVVLTATAKDGSGVTASKTITITRGVTNIEIIGADSITEVTTYMANILPDYATNKEVEWSINNTEIATIDQNGLVTPVTGGLITITATAKDGSGVSATKEINIIKLAETIEITGEESISSPAQYTAIVSPDYTSDKDVSWSIDNEEIATVDELGIVTPVTSGTVILTAAAKDGSGAFATKTIEIVKFAESIEIVGSEEITEPTQYNVVILPEYTTNKDAEWTVSDETVATVDENGVVTPLKNGKIVLTAKALDASGIETTKSIIITVSVRANSITSDVGIWDKEFDSDITEYTINVPVGTTAIYLTSSFTNATAKVNGTIAANGVRKKVSLTGNETNVEIVLTPTSGNNLKANTYTIKVVCGSFTKTTISTDGKTFTITPINIENGKTVILALYDGEKFVEMQSATYEGKGITFTTAQSYTNAKVMVLNDLTSLKPVCKVEEIN